MHAQERRCVPKNEVERLRCLQELASSLGRASDAVLKRDIGRLETETTRQRELSNELRTLYSVISQNEEEPATDEAVESKNLANRERYRNLTKELRRVEMQVRQLNLQYGALLRRSRRTVDIFCRILTHCGLTYGPTGGPFQASGGGSRDV
jgi:flagellar biosynthesis/type III secretory pathway chaperone